MKIESESHIATFAGGCFWCIQPPFDAHEWVLQTWVGYTGGSTPDPTYEAVCSEMTGHAEAVEVHYDPKRVSYEELLDIFWRNIDPTTKNGQFADRGSQYRTGIFYHDEQQKKWAEASRDALVASGKFSKPIVTEITPAGPFYPAEEYHQKYYQKKKQHYQAYKEGSGRVSYLKKIWEHET